MAILSPCHFFFNGVLPDQAFYTLLTHHAFLHELLIVEQL